VAARINAPVISKRETKTNLARVHLVSLPLDVRLALDPYSGRRTIWGTEIASSAVTFAVAPTRTRAPGTAPAPAPARRPFRSAPPVLHTPAPAPTSAPVDADPSRPFSNAVEVATAR
jgi:hypothetical protein